MPAREQREGADEPLVSFTVDVYEGGEGRPASAVVREQATVHGKAEGGSPGDAAEKAWRLAARRLRELERGAEPSGGPAAAPPELKRALLRAAVVSLSLAALLVVAIFLAGDFEETEGKLLLTTLIAGLYSVTSLGCATVLERLPPLAWAGFLVAAIGVLLGLVATWWNWDELPSGLIKAPFVALVVSLSFAHGSLLVARSRPGDSAATRAILIGTLALIVVLAAMLSAAIVVDEDPAEAFWRVLGSVAVLDLVGTALLPIVRRLER